MFVQNLLPRFCESDLVYFDTLSVGTRFYLPMFSYQAEPGWYEKTGVGQARPVDLYIVVEIAGCAPCYKP